MAGIKMSIWRGFSGIEYLYQGVAVGSELPNLPCNYIFTREEWEARKPLYIGQAENLGARIANHDKWPCLRANGVTHIHYRLNDQGEANRLAEERDLLYLHAPTCNA